MYCSDEEIVHKGYKWRPPEYNVSKAREGHDKAFGKKANNIIFKCFLEALI